MATSEKRTLSITAKLNDLLSKPLSGMQAKFIAFGKGVLATTKGILSSVFNLKTAVIGLATSFVSLSTIRSFGEQADALLKLSSSTGDAIENLSELQAAFDLAGVKAEGFDSVIRALLTQVRKAKVDGTDKLQEGFANLGISVQDLDRLGPSQLFEKMAAGLEQFSTAQEKAQALGRVLPKQFLELLPILGGGLRKFQDAIVEARQAGATVTEQQAKVSERLNDSLSKIQIAIGGVSRALIEQFGPDAIAVLERLARAITENRDEIVAVSQAVGTGLVKAFGLAADAVVGLIEVLESIPGVQLFDATEIDAQIAELKRKRDEIWRTQFAPRNVLKDEDEFLAAVREIDARITKLRSESGLAGQLRKLRAELGAELGAAAASVRDTAPPTQWSKEDGDRWAAGMQAAFGSVFQAPASGASSALPDSEALAADVDRAAESFARLNEEAKKAAESSKQYFAFAGDFWDGFGQGAREAISAWTDYGAAGKQAAETIITGGLDGVTNAIVETTFALDGSSRAWKDLGLSVLADLQRIIVKLTIIKTLQAALGYTGTVALESGGVVEGNMGTPKRFAYGGIATGPTLAMFGEGRNAEAFVPLPDNRRIPVMLMGNGGGGPTIVINVSAADAHDVDRLLIRRRETILGVWRHDVENRVGTRQLIQRTAR